MPHAARLLRSFVLRSLGRRRLRRIFGRAGGSRFAVSIRPIRKCPVPAAVATEDSAAGQGEHPEQRAGDNPREIGPQQSAVEHPGSADECAAEQNIDQPRRRADLASTATPWTPSTQAWLTAREFSAKLATWPLKVTLRLYLDPDEVVVDQSVPGEDRLDLGLYLIIRFFLAATRTSTLAGRKAKRTININSGRTRSAFALNAAFWASAFSAPSALIRFSGTDSTSRTPAQTTCREGARFAVAWGRMRERSEARQLPRRFALACMNACRYGSCSFLCYTERRR
jgi:hypothetical protein